jgi:hypothetical protein
MLKLYPEKTKRIRAEFAYATNFFRRGRFSESSGPLIRNCSSMPKTLSDIAKQLLASWEQEKELPNLPCVDSNIRKL